MSNRRRPMRGMLIMSLAVATVAAAASSPLADAEDARTRGLGPRPEAERNAEQHVDRADEGAPKRELRIKKKNIVKQRKKHKGEKAASEPEDVTMTEDVMPTMDDFRKGNNKRNVPAAAPAPKSEVDRMGKTLDRVKEKWTTPDSQDGDDVSNDSIDDEGWDAEEGTMEKLEEEGAMLEELGLELAAIEGMRARSSLGDLGLDVGDVRFKPEDIPIDGIDVPIDGEDDDEEADAVSNDNEDVLIEYGGHEGSKFKNKRDTHRRDGWQENKRDTHRRSGWQGGGRNDDKGGGRKRKNKGGDGERKNGRGGRGGGDKKGRNGNVVDKARNGGGGDVKKFRDFDFKRKDDHKNKARHIGSWHRPNGKPHNKPKRRTPPPTTYYPTEFPTTYVPTYFPTWYDDDETGSGEGSWWGGGGGGGGKNDGNDRWWGGGGDARGSGGSKSGKSDYGNGWNNEYHYETYDPTNFPTWVDDDHA